MEDVFYVSIASIAPIGGVYRAQLGGGKLFLLPDAPGSEAVEVPHYNPENVFVSHKEAVRYLGETMDNHPEG